MIECYKWEKIPPEGLFVWPLNPIWGYANAGSSLSNFDEYSLEDSFFSGLIIYFLAFWVFSAI